MPTPHEILFARFAVDYGLLTDADVDRCWRERDALRAAGDPNPLPLPKMAERLELLSPYQVAGIEVLMREQGRQGGQADTACGDSSAPSEPSAKSSPPGGVGIPTPPEGAALGPDSPTVKDTRPDRGSRAASTAPSRAMLGGYTILKEIGRGGMGVVYEATQLRLNRRVALKVMASTRLDPEGLERLKREALAAAKLSHPNVVQVFDCGEEEGTPYFAMEFVEGTSIAALIGKPEMTRERAVRLALQAAEGLHAAHEAGILHRDIKPANLLVGAGDRLVITDFGLARDESAATITQENQVLGTPRYMSPEQANGVRSEVDRRTDVYSLGATLYEMVTGKPIFDEKDGHILHQVLMRDPRPPRAHDPRLPLDLETVILKATAKEAERRYATAAELGEDLGRYLGGQHVLARRPGWAERVVRRVRRNLRTTVTVAAVLLVSAWGLAYAWHRAGVAGRAKKAIEIAQKAREVTFELEVRVPARADTTQESQAVDEAREKLRAAIGHLETATQLDPLNPRLQIWLAELCLRSTDPARAMELAANAMYLDPLDEWIHYVHARADLEKQINERTKQNLSVLAVSARRMEIRALARARLALLERNADAVHRELGGPHRAHMDQAEALRLEAHAHGLRPSRNDKERAVSCMLASLRFGQSTMWDYLWLGRWHAELNRWTEADRCFLSAMAHIEDRTILWIERGVLRAEMGDYHEAENCFGHAIAGSSLAPIALLHRGDLYVQMGSFAAAEADYQSSSAAISDDSAVLCRLFRLYLKWQGAEQARTYHKMLREQGKLAPRDLASQDWGAFLQYIATLLTVELWDDAEEALEIGLARTPTEPDLYSLRGQLNFHRGDWHNSVADFTQAISLFPTQGKFYVWRSRAHAQLKAHAESILDLTSAIRLSPATRDLYLKRSFRLFQALRIPDGLNDIERAVLMSSTAEVEEIRNELLGISKSEHFEKLDNRTRSLAITLLPQLSHRLCSRGHQYMRSNETQSADAAFERARAVDPDGWRAYLGLAMVCTRRNQWDVAAFRLGQAVDRGCTDTSAIHADPGLSTLLSRTEGAPVRIRLEHLTK